MRDYIKSVVDPNLTQNQNLNRIREYLQAYFLNILYKNKFYQNLVFTGGTALRFIYKIRRFSEDLDFSLSTKAKNYNFTDMVRNILREFKLAGYELEIKYDESRAVHSALLKFPDILFETGLSPLKSQKIAIKVEVDSNPPPGGIETSSVYNSNFMFYMLHYDLASLFAGKVHALLCREYTKGRDWYDLLWYLTKFKDLEPNFIMLNNAFAQTSRKPAKLTAVTWKAEIKKTVETLDWAKVRNDVGRFLEDSSELGLLEAKPFVNLLEK
ncbi:MAG: nucleotidyl transferase AbiEii/AbiGii toxin family protein [Candidatus Omnitrophica bacterium]|nr:nucleotidyl transferase AbiEii/AbiGii toxin family protein [Candidatus Omnitrophota bacterium]MBU4303254.1 nucleotidyl transferase AbiEii/AbiGii toxin family protein [Candidatus Omnitrophota bacterium]MBU4419323.1 nucleotidyl transferase AbiEii/AbiGii toxin family protein [Candidatus Omnitrophota bacterium]MBU4467226.1 nucleotidyl transferase AbiEii/AbiGii toxin family protein [Candidatus Omnitrophota bacterium]MCG2707283.1 nucleotidyl transferase AbiEii/AbiGii toxin family protein [Candidat